MLQVSPLRGVTWKDFHAAMGSWHAQRRSVWAGSLKITFGDGLALKLQCVGEFGGWKVCFRVGVGESCAFSVFDMVGECFLRAWDKANGQGVKGFVC